MLLPRGTTTRQWSIVKTHPENRPYSHRSGTPLLLKTSSEIRRGFSAQMTLLSSHRSRATKGHMEEGRSTFPEARFRKSVACDQIAVFVYEWIRNIEFPHPTHLLVAGQCGSTARSSTKNHGLRISTTRTMTMTTNKRVHED